MASSEATIDLVGARLVAEHRQRRGNLRLGDRRGEVAKLDVGVIAQVTDRRGAVARQHVERIGQLAAAVLARLRRPRHEIAQAVDGERKARRRHVEFHLAGPRQEIGDVGIEPGVVAADRPKAERAIGVLAREKPRDGVVDALASMSPSSARCACPASSLT